MLESKPWLYFYAKRNILRATAFLFPSQNILRFSHYHILSVIMGLFYILYTGPVGGTHMLRHTGMCRPNGLLFHQKILRHGSHFGEKKLSEEGPISQNFQKKKKKKNCKIICFWGRKILRYGSQFAKMLKKKTVYSAVFLSEKNP